MSDELPDKIVQMDFLRINRSLGKKCHCLNRKFLIDPNERLVYCQECGAKIDAFDASCSGSRG